VGVTNRPDLIDTSLLRPGRLDLIVYIGPPDEQARLEIIKLLTSSMPIAFDVNVQDIAQSTKGFSGADLVALCREAAVSAMRSKSSVISKTDFGKSLHMVKPSITKDVEDWYESIRKNVTSAMPKTIDKAFYG
ncbi:MAG: AAA family ATPase, partial [Nitrososphaeraceae archaeon]